MARRHQLLVPLLLLAGALAPTAALANEVKAGSCPLLVAPSNSEFHPKRIQPSQVAGNNAGGCLSPEDAIYGSDGGDFQERCHSWAAVQAACINGSCCA